MLQLRAEVAALRAERTAASNGHVRACPSALLILATCPALLDLLATTDWSSAHGTSCEWGLAETVDIMLLTG